MALFLEGKAVTPSPLFYKPQPPPPTIAIIKFKRNIYFYSDIRLPLY